MFPAEIIVSLKSLTQKHGIKVSEIERECLVPKNSLASVITGKKSFPMKHKEKLQEYCKAKEIGVLLGSDKNEKLDGRQWVAAVSDFCEKRGWKAEELIGKIEGFETRIKYYAESKIELEEEFGRITEENIALLAKNAALETQNGRLLGTKFINHFVEGQNKPNTAPQIENEGESTPKDVKGKEGAIGGLKIVHEGTPLSEEDVRQIALNAQNYQKQEQMPEGLTPIQQAVWKNNQKLKNKKPVVTHFGSSKKDKE